MFQIAIRQSVDTVLPPAVYKIKIQPSLLLRILAKFRYISNNESQIFTFWFKKRPTYPGRRTL
jgi:hypothetical protein